jgi:beta-galactosidase
VGQITPVHVFTSGDEAELFVNGKSQGRRKKGVYEYRLRWDEVTYAPGEVRVVVWKRGRHWAASSVRTAQTPTGLQMTPDRSTVRADGRDLSFVTVRVVDKNGVTAPRADHRIRFSIEGPGEIVATDNGDPTSFEPFSSAQRAAFNGLCLVVVRGKANEGGAINLVAESESLQKARVTLRSVR